MVIRHQATDMLASCNSFNRNGTMSRTAHAKWPPKFSLREFDPSVFGR
jgi:hypothetical protein